MAFIIGLFKVDHERSYFIYKCAKRAYKYSEHSTTYCFDRGFNQDQEHESTVAVICGQPQTCIRTCCKETQYLSSEGSCTNYQNQPENWITDFTEDAAVFQSIPCTHGYFENLTNYDWALTDYDWSFESDGSLFLDIVNIPSDQYCLTNLEDSQNGTYTLQAFVCHQGSDEN